MKREIERFLRTESFKKRKQRLLMIPSMGSSATGYHRTLCGAAFPNFRNVIKGRFYGQGGSILTWENDSLKVPFTSDLLVYGHMLPFNNVDFAFGLSKEPMFLVLIRNFPDLVVSAYDKRVRNTKPVTSEVVKKKTGFEWPYWNEASRGQRMAYLIDVFMVWFLRFAQQWREVARNYPVTFATFEEVTQLPEKYVRSIGRCFGLEIDEAGLRRAIGVRTATYNAGKVGRGKTLLEEEEKARIEMIICSAFSCGSPNMANYLKGGLDCAGVTAGDLIEMRNKGNREWWL